MRNISFVKYFTEEEKEIILANVGIIEDLHTGWNYAVDVTDFIGRTANVDIEVVDE